jgi:hypothetical protein
VAGDLIPFLRVKLLERRDLPARLAPVEKVPPKGRELRAARPPSRIAGLQVDGVALLAGYKLAHRIKRAPKMRLFRSFKLFTGMKRQPSPLGGLRSAAPERRTLRKFVGSAS